MKKNSVLNLQDLWKLVALITMIVDHIGLYLLRNEVYFWFRLIGRFAMPIFLFFAGYNYFKTKKRDNIDFAFQNKRFIYLNIAALFLQVGLVLFTPFHILNILFSISLSYLFVDAVDKFKFTQIRPLIFGLLVIVIPFSFEFVDYGSLAILFFYMGYIYQDDYKKPIYSIGLAITLIVLLIFSIYLFPFTYVQNIILLIMVMSLYLIMDYGYFDANLQCRALGLSRHILLIYAIHQMLFITLYNYYN